MSGRTQRFGLSKFGGSVPGMISDDGQKYTSTDRDTIDRLLAQIETHTHRYQPLVGAPTAGPVLALADTGGQLRGGNAYSYRFAIVDEHGRESIASPESTVLTPALLPPPGLPQMDVDESATPPTGDLAPGIYYYALTGLRSEEESVLGPALAVPVVDGISAARLKLPAFGDATAFQVWRMGPREVAYTRIAVVEAPTTTFVDDGSVPADPCACDPTNMPPTQNTGVSSYAITVTLPSPTLLSDTDQGWRIYRTTRSGVYTTASLVAFVTELNDEFDLDSGIVQSFVDTGRPLQNGQPLQVDQNMAFQPYAFDRGDELPDPTPYPECYPFVRDGVLHIRRGGAWVPVRADEAIPHGVSLPDPGGLSEYSLFAIGRRLYMLVAGAWEVVGGAAPTPPILTASNGARFRLTVASDGTLSTEPTGFPGAPTPVTDVLANGVSIEED